MAWRCPFVTVNDIVQNYLVHQRTLVDFHTASHGSEPSFAGLHTPKALVMDLSTSESNGNAKSNFSWKALFAATASQLTP